jgi:hypothetical protein
MNEFPTREDFLKQLNTKFRVYFNAENPTEVELTEVSELRQQPRYEAFNITLLAPNDIPPEQMLYKVEHDSLGAMELFLVPFDRNEKGLYFESIFNYKIIPADG